MNINDPGWIERVTEGETVDVWTETPGLMFVLTDLLDGRMEVKIEMQDKSLTFCFTIASYRRESVGRFFLGEGPELTKGES